MKKEATIDAFRNLGSCFVFGELIISHIRLKLLNRRVSEAVAQYEHR